MKNSVIEVRYKATGAILLKMDILLEMFQNRFKLLLHVRRRAMRKREEVLNPASCLNKAGENEMLFVLLGRDLAAPAAIRAWIKERIEKFKNSPSDPQIVEALACAEIMEKESKI